MSYGSKRVRLMMYVILSERLGKSYKHRYHLNFLYSLAANTLTMNYDNYKAPKIYTVTETKIYIRTNLTKKKKEKKEREKNQKV